MEQWHVQIRRKGWPNQTGTFRTKVEAETWARDIESSMDKGVFVDRSRGHEETLADLIDLYRKEVTNKRPGEASRIAEKARLDRFLRDEATLCSYELQTYVPNILLTTVIADLPRLHLAVKKVDADAIKLSSTMSN